MLLSTMQIDGAKILASDGEIGEVDDVYFDDEQWVMRYLVVSTGRWLSRHNVLISPYAVSDVDLLARAISVKLTRQQVQSSPDIDTDKPVSRQQEAQYHRYFGYPAYWPYATYWPWGATPAITPVATGTTRPEAEEVAHEEGDSHLRSAKEVRGYHIQASDERLGHVEDFLVDVETWAIRYLVIDTRNFWPGRHVLVAPEWVRATDWLTRTLSVVLSREEIERSPEYDPDHLPSRDYEQELYRHYARPTYWG